MSPLQLKRLRPPAVLACSCFWSRAPNISIKNSHHFSWISYWSFFATELAHVWLHQVYRFEETFLSESRVTIGGWTCSPWKHQWRCLNLVYFLQNVTFQTHLRLLEGCSSAYLLIWWSSSGPASAPSPSGGGLLWWCWGCPSRSWAGPPCGCESPTDCWCPP